MDRYSKLIRLLIIALPLLAAGILFAVFFYDWRSQEDVSDQFAEQDRDFPELQTAIEAPTISTRTESGDAVDFSADNITQAAGADSKFLAENVGGDLSVGGTDWSIESDEGETGPKGNLAKFRGSVKALIDEQYNLIGTELVANIAERTFNSGKPIAVESERFDLNADSGSMAGEKGQRVIELHGNVSGKIRFESNEGN